MGGAGRAGVRGLHFDGEPQSRRPSRGTLQQTAKKNNKKLEQSQDTLFDVPSDEAQHILTLCCVLTSGYQDFGIKYNCENGGPAPESLTDAIYKNTTTISKLKVAEGLPEVSGAPG